MAILGVDEMLRIEVARKMLGLLEKGISVPAGNSLVFLTPAGIVQDRESISKEIQMEVTEIAPAAPTYGGIERSAFPLPSPRQLAMMRNPAPMVLYGGRRQKFRERRPRPVPEKK